MEVGQHNEVEIYLDEDRKEFFTKYSSKVGNLNSEVYKNLTYMIDFKLGMVKSDIQKKIDITTEIEKLSSENKTLIQKLIVNLNEKK